MNFTLLLLKILNKFNYENNFYSNALLKVCILYVHSCKNNPGEYS